MKSSLYRKLYTCVILLIVLFLSHEHTQASTGPNALALPSFAPLIEKTMPAVVNIYTTQSIDVEGKKFGMGPQFKFNFPDSPEFEMFREFFEHDFGGGEGESRKKRMSSLGSGFIVDPTGYIVTNHHVIADAEEVNVMVTMNNEEKSFPAKVIGSDKKTDLAILKIEAKNSLPFLKFGNSSKSKVGDWIITIGNPFGLGGTVTTGIISAKSRFIAGQFDEFIQTDASINRGNSGGPMINLDGEVIGVNSVIISPSGGNVGIGLSIPSNSAQAIVAELKKNGTIIRSWLGVKIQSITDDISKNLGFKDNKGALVAEVIEKSPASKAGIMVGDVIRKFNGTEVDKMPRLPSIVAETPINTKVKVEVIRNGKVKTLTVRTEKFEDDSENDSESKKSKGNKDDSGNSQSKSILGMKVENLNKLNTSKFNINKESKGVLITRVNRNSSAHDSGLKAGDLIQQINNLIIKDVNSLEKIINKAKKSGSKTLVMLVNREGGSQFVVLYLN